MPMKKSMDCTEKINDKNIDITLKIPSKNTATIQTVTQVLYHSICELLEEL